MKKRLLILPWVKKIIITSLDELKARYHMSILQLMEKAMGNLIPEPGTLVDQ